MKSVIGKISHTFFEPYSIIRDKCFVFAILISIMVYVFSLSEGNFKLLVIAQGLFSFWLIYNFIFNLGETRFSFYGITAWWILSLVLIGNLWINNANYSVAEKSFQFAAAHIVGILIFVLAAQWAARNLNPERILECLAWMLAPLVLFAIFLKFGRVR